MPVVMDRGFGVTIKDPDGNTFIDLSAGVGVSSVGRCHPKVVEAMRKQSEILMHAMEVNSTKRTKLAAKISEIMPDLAAASSNPSGPAPARISPLRTVRLRTVLCSVLDYWCTT